MPVHGYQWKWDFVKGEFLFVSKNREDAQNFTMGLETERMSELSWSLSLTVLPNFKGPFPPLKEAGQLNSTRCLRLIWEEEINKDKERKHISLDASEVSQLPSYLEVAEFNPMFPVPCVLKEWSQGSFGSCAQHRSPSLFSLPSCGSGIYSTTAWKGSRGVCINVSISVAFHTECLVFFLCVLPMCWVMALSKSCMSCEEMHGKV